VIVVSEYRFLLDRRPTLDGATGTDGHVGFDDAERADFDVGPDLSRGTDDRRWMNAHGGYLMEEE
jgi:hypothetical protein